MPVREEGDTHPSLSCSTCGIFREEDIENPRLQNCLQESMWRPLSLYAFRSYFVHIKHKILIGYLLFYKSSTLPASSVLFLPSFHSPLPPTCQGPEQRAPGHESSHLFGQ